MFRRWIEGVLQSVLAAIIVAIIPGVLVTYLAHIQSAWTKPLLLGLCAAVLIMVFVLAADAIRRLPPRRVIPTLKNIDSCVRGWLDNFHCSVKKSPVDTAHFRYEVTVDSGIKMLVGRTKDDFDDYIQIRADMNPTEDDLRHFNVLSELEKAIVIGNIRLELARRYVGYRNLSHPLKDFYMSKRVPIRESLMEHEFMAAIDEVESASHSVMFVFALEIAKTGKLSGDTPRKELEIVDTL